jgi:hypothetical protein
MTVEIDLLALVERITNRRAMDPVAAAILAAAHLDICHDSRQFARLFDIAHALVIRDCNTLADELGLLSIDTQNARTQSLRYSLTADARALLAD